MTNIGYVGFNLDDDGENISIVHEVSLRGIVWLQVGAILFAAFIFVAS